MVSRRSASSFDLPSVNSAINFNASKVTDETESWVKLGFKVSRPIISDNAITNASRVVFAQSNAGPDTVNDPNSPFPFHGPSKGLLDPINFLGAGETSTASDDNSGKILIAHGILFFIAWGVAPFIGIFVARYLKNVMGIWWYRVHVGSLVLVTGLFSLISFILIVLNTEPPHFDGNHQKIGLAIFVFTFIQFALGYVSNALWKPTRTAIPWWDVAHWYVGRSLLIVAIVNIFLGMLEYSEDSEEDIKGLKVAYWVWIGVMVCLMVAGQFYFGAQQHVEPKKPIEQNLETSEH